MPVRDASSGRACTRGITLSAEEQLSSRTRLSPWGCLLSPMQPGWPRRAAVPRRHLTPSASRLRSEEALSWAPTALHVFRFGFPVV